MYTNDNYFDIDEEDVVHDVFLMIQSDETDYDCIEDVILGETTYDGALPHWIGGQNSDK